uniref:Uncharacterized protein n=1 Tax=Timema poppense TaxID=170557 RepID=A0A7R9CFE3_TIMPO|nr:unnamed protein product [Timema poppensis]
MALAKIYEVGNDWSWPGYEVGNDWSWPVHEVGNDWSWPGYEVGNYWSWPVNEVGNNWSLPGYEVGNDWGLPVYEVGNNWSWPVYEVGNDWSWPVYEVVNNWSWPAYEVGNNWSWPVHEVGNDWSWPGYEVGKATEPSLNTLINNDGPTNDDNKVTDNGIGLNKDDTAKPSQENRNKPAEQINPTDPLLMGPVHLPKTASGASPPLVQPKELFVSPLVEENLTRQVSPGLSSNRTLINNETKNIIDTDKMVEQSKESLDGTNKTIAPNIIIKPNKTENNITRQEATVETIEKPKTQIKNTSNTFKEKTALDGEAKEQIQKVPLYESGNVLKVNDADKPQVTEDITFKVPGLETKSGELEESPLNIQNNEEDNLSIGDYNQGEAPMDSDTDMSGADEPTNINYRVNVEAEPDVPPAQNLEEKQTGKMPAEGPDDTDYNRRGAFSDDEDSHFFAYFMTMVLVCIIGYLVFHNKQKVKDRF